jgi:predicted O-methyltransferase YrrM
METNETHNMPVPTPLSPRRAIVQITRHVLLARALAVAAELGIADLVSREPQCPAELAAATGTHADSLHRLLRMLASHGIFAEDDRGRFQLTPMAAVLQTGNADSLRDYLRFFSGDTAWNAYRDLLHTVRTGEDGFAHAYGMEFFAYLAAHADVGALFSAGMAQATARENAAIASAYAFGQFARLVDVGGGGGGLLAAVLTAYPTVRGVLYEQPAVAANPAVLQAAGVMERCEVVGGDFFQSVPAAGNAYVLKRVLHDWNDAQAIQILHRCREAMAREGCVLTIEGVIRPGNALDPLKDMDVLVGMALTGGRERTEAEFRTLYEKAGLYLTRVIPTPATVSIVEGVRG